MSGVEDCFYHEAIAPGNATSKEKQAVPAISQIPGWGCSDVTSTAAPSVGGRRMGLFEHDSDYVRLAKMGGRANLLSHPESANRVQERVLYSKPDWMVYESFTPSVERVKANVIPDYMIHDRPVPSHLPGGGKPPWAEDGQSCFRREGEESVRSYKTTKINNPAKPGQKRLDADFFNTNNNNSSLGGDGDGAAIDADLKLSKWNNRRYQAGVRLGELESDFRDARRGREQASAAAGAMSTAGAGGDVGGYSPSSPSAQRRGSPTVDRRP